MIDVQNISLAHVYLREKKAGFLERKFPRGYGFTYFTEYLLSPAAQPISFLFPLQPQEFYSEKLHPFFDNLILEGWLLHQAEKIFHLSKTERFALLMLAGRFPIGGVTVVPIDRRGQEIPIAQDSQEKGSPSTHQSTLLTSPFKSRCPSCLLPSQKGSLHRPCALALFGTSKPAKIKLDSTAPQQSFIQTIYGGSISGAQRKGLFYFSKVDNTLISQAHPSTHILKPEGDFPELPANEHLTMSVAQQLGFTVPPMGLFRVDGIGLIFVIKRFDIADGGNLLFEDTAQLLGMMSEEKYQGSCERVAKAVAQSASPLDLSEFFRRLVFCYLTGNGDMHLKNWAVLESAKIQGDFHLSPVYDLLNTRIVLPREPVDIALPMDGKQRNLRQSTFRKFARETLKLQPAFVDSVFASLPKWFEVIEKAVPHSALSVTLKAKYLDVVQERFQNLTKPP